MLYNFPEHIRDIRVQKLATTQKTALGELLRVPGEWRQVRGIFSFGSRNERMAKNHMMSAKNTAILRCFDAVAVDETVEVDGKQWRIVQAERIAWEGEGYYKAHCEQYE